MNELTRIIRREIAVHGVISFARFMERSLYHPQLGYYEQPSQQIGCQGDFYTSVSVGNLFGELLAFQFARWFEKLAESHPAPTADRARALRLIEAGAHDGQLASDVLNWMECHEGPGFKNLEYWILEPSASRRQRQAEKLDSLASCVRWFDSWESLPNPDTPAVIFSNELLDAFPVHRIGWDAKSQRWFEWGVTWAHDRFAWQRMPGEVHSASAIPRGFSWPELPDNLLRMLPDGFTTELSPWAEQWWKQAAQTLQRGWLLTIDYGLETEEFFLPQRSHGTARAYRGHHLCSDLLADPGEQDLTAQLNFTALRQVGEKSGLRTALFGSQAAFLTRLLEEMIARGGESAAWPSERLRQFQTLTHPEHLGRSFKVLVQARL